VERLFTVVFGPSRSKRFAKAVESAQLGPGECTEIEPGRYQVCFRLGTDADVYKRFAWLLERVRYWRATELYDDDEEQISAFHAKEMAWCVAFHLETSGGCRAQFGLGIMPRCGVCPLFDSERAIRAGFHDEQTPEDSSATDVDLLDGDAGGWAIVLGPEMVALLARELPDWLDLTRLFPDQPPQEWTEPEADAPCG
jgi:hypothetical protein